MPDLAREPVNGMPSDLRELELGPAFAKRVEAQLPESVFRFGRTRSTKRIVPWVAPAVAFASEPELPAVGSVIGTYRLERAIGIGGFGAVYQARHVVLDTVVAIKLMRPSVMRERPSLQRLLLDEARFGARLDHPHVVRVIDISTDAPTYIVMEYVDGPDLAVMIKRRGALPPPMVVRILRHITFALAAGLAQNVIHCDIKPSNILLTKLRTTKLVDFGLARSSGPVPAGTASVVAGTAGYMSPEQLDRGPIDFRTDLYSLGVTAYQALTGSLPFTDADPARCADAHRYQPVVPPHHLVPEIAHGLSGLVTRLLAKRPGDRPASYAELATALEADALR